MTVSGINNVMEDNLQTEMDSQSKGFDKITLKTKKDNWFVLSEETRPAHITAYLCTGILSSLTSLWWHTEEINSAGASGAIFGMYGLFLALLASNLIPKQAKIPLLGTVGIFVVYNFMAMALLTKMCESAKN